MSVLGTTRPRSTGWHGRRSTWPLRMIRIDFDHQSGQLTCYLVPLYTLLIIESHVKFSEWHQNDERREPASQALFCHAFLSQTNDVEWRWNDDENEPLCLVPLYILSINGQTENDIGNDIGTSLQPVVGYYISSIQGPM